MTTTEEAVGIDQQAMVKFLSLLHQPGQVFEVRALNTSGRYSAIWSGYFDARDTAVAQLLASDVLDKADAVYVTLNTIDPALHSRKGMHDQIMEGAKSGASTSNHDVRRLQWLLLDIDPVRPSGVASTDEQHKQAIQRAREVMVYLKDEGWPLPMAFDSGNGAALLYPIDLPPQDTELVKGALAGLDFTLSDADVHIDTSVGTGAHLVRLPGTMNRKGAGDEARPHRPAQFLGAVPPNPRSRTVGRARLEALAALVPKPETPPRKGMDFDLQGWITEHAPEFDGPTAWAGGQKWVADVCPWDSSHANRSAYIVQMGHGAIGAGCQHTSCAGNDWHVLRALREPGWQEYRPSASSERPSTALETHAPASRVRLTRMSDVTPEAVQWLWPDRIPYGKITIIAGDPGVGKSFLLEDLAARVSVGGELPDRQGRIAQGSVLMLVAEDGLADTIRPRLDGQGADASKVLVIESVDEPNGTERLVNLQKDIEQITRAIEDTAASVVIIDPINAYLGSTDGHKDTEIRNILSPLKVVAERTGAAFILVMHLSKGSAGSKPIYRVISSIGFTAAARSVLAVAKSPEDPDIRVLVPVKSSVSKDAPGLTFTINSEPALVWGEASTATAEELLGDSSGSNADASSVEDAKAFLEDELQAGPLRSSTVEQGARANGISIATLRRAQEALGISRANGSLYRETTGNKGEGGWWWKLPDSYVAHSKAPEKRATYGDKAVTTPPYVAQPLDALGVSNLPAAVNESPNSPAGTNGHGPHVAPEPGGLRV